MVAKLKKTYYNKRVTVANEEKEVLNKDIAIDYYESTFRLLVIISYHILVYEKAFKNIPKKGSCYLLSI